MYAEYEDYSREGESTDAESLSDLEHDGEFVEDLDSESEDENEVPANVVVAHGVLHHGILCLVFIDFYVLI